MREALWRLFAFIVSRPAIASLIIAGRHRRPAYFDLSGYMERWWWMPAWCCAWSREEKCFKPARWNPFSVRLHHILRADADRVLHDHPFNWRTIVIRGFYVEEDVCGEEFIRLAGDTRRATCETLHRINRVSTGGVWTLFFMSRKKQSWGFMAGDPPRKVLWHDYESANDRPLPGKQARLARLKAVQPQ